MPKSQKFHIDKNGYWLQLMQAADWQDVIHIDIKRIKQERGIE